MKRALSAACLAAALLWDAAAGATIPGQPAEPPVPGLTRAPEIASSASYKVETVARGLEFPWSLAWLPDGRMLVTEKPGRLRIVSKDGALSGPVAGLPPLHFAKQGGLFEVLPDPGFARNRLVYLSYYEPRQDGKGLSVARARLTEANGPARLQDLQVIFRAERKPGPDPGDLNIAGKLAFGRDGDLYISVGDRFKTRDEAQDLGSDLGKIVRIRPDGSIPRDNPFVGKPGARPEIWSLGHRTPEGLAVNPATGEMWENEHGAKGGDEVNVLRKGRNYGWPIILYGVDYSGAPIGEGRSKPGLEQPLYYWDPSIAPSGMAFYTGGLFPQWRGSLFIGALKWKRLIRLTLNGGRVTGEEELLGDLGERIREVRQGPDGAIYLLTDNALGRILRVVPAR